MLRTRCRRDAGVNPLTSGLPRAEEAYGPCMPTPIFERYKMSPAFNKLPSIYNSTNSQTSNLLPSQFSTSLDRLSCAVILSSSCQSSRPSSASLHSFHHQTCPSSSSSSRSTISVPRKIESRCAPSWLISSVIRPVGKPNPSLYPHPPTLRSHQFSSALSRTSRLLQTNLDYFSHKNSLHQPHQKYPPKSM